MKFAGNDIAFVLVLVIGGVLVLLFFGPFVFVWIAFSIAAACIRWRPPKGGVTPDRG